MDFYEDNRGFLYKVCILGDGGVGKTAILERILGKDFRDTYQSTIGSEIVVYSIDIGGRNIKFQIWDIAGQPHFQFIRPMFYKGVQAAMLVFDLTLPESFRNLQLWKKELDQTLNYDIPLVILGNKADLIAESQFEEEETLVERLKNELNMGTKHFYLTSALTGRNITKAFLELGQLILKGDSGDFSQQLMFTQGIQS